MSHHYMRAHYGDHCYFRDSAWKRRQRYNAAHGDTLILSFGDTYTDCSGGPCAGKTFLSGLGLGFGMGFSSWFGGLFSGFMGMPFFGGGMFGGMFSMPFFGTSMFSNYDLTSCCSGMFMPTYMDNSFYSSSSSSSSSGTPTGAASETTTPTSANSSVGATSTTPGATPTANGTLQSVDGVPELIAKAGQIDANSTYDEIDALIADLNAKATDPTISNDDKTSLQDKINELEPKKASALVNEYIATTNPKQLDKDNLKYLVNNIDKLDTSTKNSLEIKLKDELSDLKNGTNPNDYHVSNKPTEMYKLFLLGKIIGPINLKAESNTSADDTTIEGDFTDLRDSGDYIEYDIDCSKTGKVRAKWTLQQTSENECKPLKAVKNDKELIINQVTYQWSPVNKCWINSTGIPSIYYRNAK